MKFYLPFQLSKQGVIILTNQDKLLYTWVSLLFLFTFCFGESPVFSEKYNTIFINRYEYTNYVKDQETLNYKKLTGFELGEVISQWIYLKFPFENIIVLSNINVQAKNIQFWAKVPQTEVAHFLKEIVILKCKDKSEVIRLVENIGSDFADAHGYSSGNLITYNGE